MTDDRDGAGRLRLPPLPRSSRSAGRWRPGFRRELRSAAVRRPPDFRRAEDGRAPRLGPREYIGDQITRVGIFKDKDPLRMPRLWNRVQWTTLFGMLTMVGVAFRRAWNRHGGLPHPDRDAQDTSTADDA